MSGWEPERTRPRTKILVAVGIAVVLGILIVTALIVPPRTVARVATVTTPYAQIVGFLGGIAVIITYIRKLMLSAVRATQDAAVESTAASGRAEDAARETSQLVATLKNDLHASEAARTREADRNDRVFAALLENQAFSRDFAKWVAKQDLPQRVRRLEETEAARETEAHITGQLRLRGHEMITKQETDA